MPQVNPFLAEAEARLPLIDPERELLRETPIDSFDVLHAILRASPSLEDGRLGMRRQLLMQLCLPLLSEAYRAALQEAWPMPMPTGLNLRLAPAGPGAGLAPNWRGVAGSGSLAGAAPVDLLGRGDHGTWPVRDQGGRPTCVAHAAAAALEWHGAPPGAARPRYSTSFLYFHLRRFGAALPLQDMQRFSDGGAKLDWAKHVLSGVGICDEADWPDSKPIDEAPGNFASARAKQPFQQLECWDIGVLPVRPDAPAQAVLTLLTEGRPVAVSMPEFSDPQFNGETNWENPLTWAKGQVLPVPLFWQQAPIGHAVCILGFQPAPAEPLGGWFIFRNSRGSLFARKMPDLARRDPPIVPAPGYGAIQASLLDRCVFEIFAPR